MNSTVYRQMSASVIELAEREIEHAAGLDR